MRKSKLKFMDFCSGIGAGRLALERNGLICVGHCEINKSADKTYRLFFGENEKNYGDIMNVNCKALPNFDLMLAGFPCQSFSIAGNRNGFGDERGQVFFGLLKILKEKNVKYFIFENVKGLVNHENGETLKRILTELENAGYSVSWKVLNSINYGVPQMRERIYIIGAKTELISKPFVWSESNTTANLEDFLIDNDAPLMNENAPVWNNYLNNDINKGKYNMQDILKNDLCVIDKKQRNLRIYHNKVPTLCAGNHSIYSVKNNRLYKISGYEGLLLQGFPKEFAERAKAHGISNNALLTQSGNAMTVPVVEAVGKTLLNAIK